MNTRIIFVEKGWKNTKKYALKPYASRRDELSVQYGFLLWGSRVVALAVARDKILDEHHDSHLEISRMLKESRKKISDGDLDTKLVRFLFCFRTTPHSSTNLSPAELLADGKEAKVSSRPSAA